MPTAEDIELSLVNDLHALKKTSPELFDLQDGFERRANGYKERLLTVATWLIGIQTALLVAPFALGTVAVDGALHHTNVMVGILVFAYAFTGYAVFLVLNLNRHINRNEFRAGVIRLNHSAGTPLTAGDVRIRRLSLLPAFQICFMSGNALAFTTFYVMLCC